eukprot:scaffold6205_cov42-Phaeocystis_antarctica.AAC.1
MARAGSLSPSLSLALSLNLSLSHNPDSVPWLAQVPFEGLRCERGGAVGRRAVAHLQGGVGIGTRCSVRGVRGAVGRRAVAHL